MDKRIFKWLFLMAFSFPLFSSTDGATKNENLETVKTLQFTPPQGWRNGDPKMLPSRVKIMMVGEGNYDFPPSISLATEAFSGSVKEYLKIVKELNASKGNQWKDLGSLRTDAGNASLSQTDSKSNWGEIKMMHVIFKNEGTIYILTAAALKKEFPKFYQEIFTSLRSLHFESSKISCATP